MDGRKARRIKINVSGEIYETLNTTLNRFPHTLLGSLERRDCLFFNRHRASFNAILYYYQSSGRLSCPPNTPLHVFESECRFFQIDEDTIMRMKVRSGYIRFNTISDTDNSYRAKLWNFLENPETSKMATVFAIVSLLIIFISVVTTCAETVPQFYGSRNSDMRAFWTHLELVINAWFLAEITFRFLSTPNRWRLMKDFLTIVDIIAVLPYFVMLAIAPDGQGDKSSLGILKILRFARFIRLFRLSKHSKRLKVVGAIISSSLNDLQLLFLCLILLNILGGSTIYYLEVSEPNTEFYSIPQGIWWGITTIVTLGYGDIIPSTILGKLVAASYMIFGALTISLPVLSIVIRFTHMYEINVKEET